MSNQLKWVLSDTRVGMRVKLKGALDEYARWDDLNVEIGRAQRVHIDLQQVVRINSVGIRGWLAFIKRLTTGRTVQLERCSPCFVDHMNSMNTLIAGARVVSVMVPYVCPECSTESAVPHDVTGGAPTLAPPKCQCGAETELNAIEEAYFAFLG
jgi:hypothetical protein